MIKMLKKSNFDVGLKHLFSNVALKIFKKCKLIWKNRIANLLENLWFLIN